MARTFVRANSDHADFASGAPITGGAFSVGGWLLLNSTGLLQGLFVQSSSNVIQARVSVGNNFAFSFDGNNIDSGATVLAAGAWYHLLATYAGTGANQALLYVNGVQDAAATRTAAYNHDATKFGSLFGQAFLDGRLAEWAAWGVALSPNEVASLALGRRPHRARPASVLAYWPLWGLQSPEPDLGGAASPFNLTLTGTAAAAHAPLTTFTRKALNVQVILPQAPTNLVATPGLVSVALSWSSSTPPPVTYNVYRGIAPGTEVLLANGIAPASYTDADVLPGTSYYYKVSATDPGGEGPQSAEASAAVPPPGVPSGLTATPAPPFEAQVNLSWGAVAAATSYDVLRSLTPGGESAVLANVSGTSYADAGVALGTTYYYKVRARIQTPAGTAVGALSAEASAAPPLPPAITDAGSIWVEPPR